MRSVKFTLVVLLLASCKTASAESWLFVSLLEEKQIVTFRRDAETGELQHVTSTECPAEPAFLCVSPDRMKLFVSFRSTGELASFRIDHQSGELELICTVPGGDDPAYLQTDSKGRYLFTAYYVANKLTIHLIDDDGSLSQQPITSVPTARNAHGVAMDSRDSMVFVPHTGANRIYQFRFDAEAQELSQSDPAFLEGEPGANPRHLIMAPTDRFAYCSNEAGDGISAYAVDSATSTLTLLQTLSTIPDDFDGEMNATARCELSPDGRFAFVANRGHDSLAVFGIDTKSGRMTPLGITPTEKTPRSFSIDPSGQFLYAAGQSSGKIAAYRITAEGALERFGTYESGPISWYVLAVDSIE